MTKSQFEPSSELSFLQTQLADLKQAFDLAIQKDLTLGEVKNMKAFFGCSLIRQ